MRILCPMWLASCSSSSSCRFMSCVIVARCYRRFVHLMCSGIWSCAFSARSRMTADALYGVSASSRFLAKTRGLFLLLLYSARSWIWASISCVRRMGTPRLLFPLTMTTFKRPIATFSGVVNWACRSSYAPYEERS